MLSFNRLKHSLESLEWLHVYSLEPFLIHTLFLTTQLHFFQFLNLNLPRFASRCGGKHQQANQ
jgi:hypothetical protein